MAHAGHSVLQKAFGDWRHTRHDYWLSLYYSSCRYSYLYTTALILMARLKFLCFFKNTRVVIFFLLNYCAILYATSIATVATSYAILNIILIIFFENIDIFVNFPKFFLKPILRVEVLDNVWFGLVDLMLQKFQEWYKVGQQLQWDYYPEAFPGTQ